MSLGELYQQDVDRSLSTMAAIPPDPPKREERSAWSAPWRIVKSAAAGVLGTVADVAKGYGAAALIADEANPVARAALGDAAVRRGGDEGRAAIASGEATVSEFGDSLRALRTEFRPDPLTASKAEQTVFGIGEGLLKIGGAALAGGPIGVGLMSAQMGAEHADDLRGQGVDHVTRTKVGLLTGAVTGVSVALPAWGSSLGRTAAWWAAGGTATVAQTALTREILQRADYARLAEQYDPLDPLQLALAYGMPAPFAGYGAWRNLRAARGSNATARPEAAPPAVAPEVVDAAMTHNLTVQQDVHEAVPPAARAAEVMRGPVTENPNFKAWFGDSKVTDANGAPLVVYHGTNADISAFDTTANSYADEVGTFFTTDSAEASSYGTGGGANVLPAYVSIKNPYTVTDRQWTAREGMTPREAMEAGFDGYVIEQRNGHKHVVAFSPEQIKSAIGNSGRFDPNSASLTDPVPRAAATEAAPPKPAAEAGDPIAKLNEPADAKPKPAADPIMSTVAMRVADLESTAPDMVVRIADDGKAVTLADDLAEVRRMVAEGTDDSLGTLDADLMRVAVECALSTGG